MNKKLKALKWIGVIIIILVIIGVLLLKYGLVNDRRTSIAKELFLNEYGQFDYVLLEQRLNYKYGSLDKREALKSFIIKNGGECMADSCKLYLYSTICFSSAVIILLDPVITVKPYNDGC